MTILTMPSKAEMYASTRDVPNIIRPDDDYVIDKSYMERRIDQISTESQSLAQLSANQINLCQSFKTQPVNGKR